MSARKKLKQYISNVLGKFDYRLVQDWEIENLPMVNKIKTIFDFFDIKIVIDVGANNGQFRNFLRHRVGFAGRIESYEPIPEICEKLQDLSKSDGDWVIHPYALGAEEGSLEFNVMASTVFSSFRSPICGENFRESNVLSKKILVPVRTLDSEFSDRNILRHAYLKLDTQGYDLEVLRGGQKCMRLIQSLQSEISIQKIYDNIPDYQEAISYIESIGFSISDLFLVTHDSRFRAIEFDCIFVKNI